MANERDCHVAIGFALYTNFGQFNNRSGSRPNRVGNGKIDNPSPTRWFDPAAFVQPQLDLNDTMREVLALVGDEAKGKSVIIRTRFAEDLSPVSGDRVQLQQVVLNLVMNGIEAMSSVGERARELLITTRNVDADRVQASVEDSGIGIDPQKLDKIFDSFYTTKPSGMGMGLSISRSILQAHGGRLWATAKEGPGTIFHFTLPKYLEGESHAGVRSLRQSLRLWTTTPRSGRVSIV